jgi:hypothetical protein
MAAREGEVTRHGRALGGHTSARVGRGPIGEVVETAVRRGLKIVEQDITAAVRKFYGGVRTGLERAARETELRDGRAKTAFDDLGQSRHDVRVGASGRPVRGAVDDSDHSGPWVHEAGDVEPGGAVAQTRPGSCVSECGEMLTGGSVTEAQFLEELGEDSNPGALAADLNRRAGGTEWRGGYFPDGATAVAAAEHGPIGAVLQAPRGGGHMVVIEPAGDGQFVVRDPIPGVTYRVTAAWIEKFVSGGVFR